MEDKRYLALSALGPDRAGLVAELTRFVREKGANIEESRMVTLGAEFGTMLLLSGPEAALAAVEASKDDVARTTGMAVVTRRTRDPSAALRERPMPCVVVAEALDHEGIVFAVASALQRLDVSITSLETSTYAAPWSGAPLFRLEAQCSLPRAVTLGDLRKALDAVAAHEGIDVEVRPPSGR